MTVSKWHTERITLVQFDKNDFDDYMSWHGSDKVMEFITGKGLTLEEGKARFARALKMNAENRDIGYLKAVHTETGAMMGLIKIAFERDGFIEVGYGSLPEFWKQGYASEMLKFAIDRCRSVAPTHTICAIVSPINIGSARVLEKAGFRLVERNYGDDGDTDFYTLPD